MKEHIKKGDVSEIKKQIKTLESKRRELDVKGLDPSEKSANPKIINFSRNSGEEYVRKRIEYDLEIAKLYESLAEVDSKRERNYIELATDWIKDAAEKEVQLKNYPCASELYGRASELSYGVGANYQGWKYERKKSEMEKNKTESKKEGGLGGLLKKIGFSHILLLFILGTMILTSQNITGNAIGGNTIKFGLGLGLIFIGLIGLIFFIQRKRNLRN